MLTADDILSDLADNSPKRTKPKGGRRSRRGHVTHTANNDDMFAGLQLENTSEKQREPEKPVMSKSPVSSSGWATNNASSHQNLYGTESESTTNYTNSTATITNKRSIAHQRPTQDAHSSAYSNLGTEGLKKQQQQQKIKEVKKVDDFGGFDTSNFYFGGGGDTEEQENSSKSSSNGNCDSFNPFSTGQSNARNTVINQSAKTRELDMNKRGAKKSKQTKKNTTKSTGPKWNRPTFDFDDDDDLELDEEELGQGTIGNGNRAEGAEKPEMANKASRDTDWTEGIEPIKKVAKPKKKKKKKQSRHMYDSDSEDDF